MNPANFVSATDLLDWLNSFFKAGYTRIEQIRDGSRPPCSMLSFARRR